MRHSLITRVLLCAALVQPAAAQLVHAPEVDLFSPYWGDRSPKRLPLDGRPTIVVPIQRSQTLLSLDLIRALRCVPAKWGERVRVATVFVGGGADTVDTANELRGLLLAGLKQTPEYTALHDPEEKWYEALGRPALPHALLMDGDGRILARELFLGPLEWELERIDALLDHREVPRAIDVHNDPAVSGHPFYAATLDVPLLPGERPAVIQPTMADNAMRIDAATIVERLAVIDAREANETLRGICETHWNFTLARKLAEAAAARFGSDAAWAAAILETHVTGLVHASTNRLGGAIRTHNASSDHEMTIELVATLRSRWDDQCVAELQQYIIAEPGSRTYATFDNFERVNAGWGDYTLHVRATITMNDGRQSNPCPAIRRTMTVYDSLTPRNEYPDEPDSPDLAGLPLAQRAVRAAIRERLLQVHRENLTGPTADSSTAVSAALRWAESAVGQVAQRTTGPARLVGKPLPKVRLANWIQGRDALPTAAPDQIADTGGKAVLLDFMFVECPPCRAALPKLTALHEQYRDRGLVVVSLVASWGQRGIHGLVERGGFRHPFAVLAEAAEQDFSVTAFPTCVLIDRRGVVRWVGIAEEPSASTIEAALASASKDFPPPRCIRTKVRAAAGGEITRRAADSPFGGPSRAATMDPCPVMRATNPEQYRMHHNRPIRNAAIVAAVMCAPASSYADILHDNGPIITNPTGGTGGIAGQPISQADGFMIPGSSFVFSTTGVAATYLADTSAADDFTIPAGRWDLDAVTLYAFQTSQTTPTIHTIRINRWTATPYSAGSPPPVPDPLPEPVLAAPLVLSAGPGTFVCHRQSASSTSSNRPVFAYTVSLDGLPNGGELPPGTYWLEWSFEGATSPSQNVFMPLVTPRTAVTGHNARLRNSIDGSPTGPRIWFEGREGFVEGQSEGRAYALPFILTGTPLPPLIPADANCDGTIDFFDIDPFLLALFDPAGYDVAFPDCDVLSADANQDAVVDFFDIDAFLLALFGG